MDELLSVLASRQPRDVEVSCEFERLSSLSVKADLHYHTKGWIVRKQYQIIYTPVGLAIVLRDLSMRPERS